MNVFDLRDRLVRDYASYTRSFIKIADSRISHTVESALNSGASWPEPLLQLSPTFLPGGTIDELVADGTLHSECAKIFRIDKSDTDHTGKPLLLHTHQREAILKATREKKSYVLTSGTGSGKNLTYIVPIVDHILRNGSGRGIQAIVVYPMNALANSQDEELGKFLKMGYPEGKSPVRFARYTGQEKGPEREAIRSNPPDILLTNYMMLELLLTRCDDRELIRAAQGLRFLVFDELHTYRGRQGADVALLIRRCRSAFGGGDITCSGTSATMASGGSCEEQKREVAKVAQTLFGVPFDVTQVIGETLERATPETDFGDQEVVQAIRTTIQTNANPPETYEEFRLHLLAAWIESTFGVRAEEGTGRLIRQAPRRMPGEDRTAEELARLTWTDPSQCAAVIRRFLLKGSELRRDASSRFPIFLLSAFTSSSPAATPCGQPSSRRLIWRCRRRVPSRATPTSRSSPLSSAASVEPPTTALGWFPKTVGKFYSHEKTAARKTMTVAAMPTSTCPNRLPGRGRRGWGCRSAYSHS